MQSDEKIIRLRQVWYFTKEVAALLELSKAMFEREILPHREALGKKPGKKWTNLQVKKILYILAPHIQVVIE